MTATFTVITREIVRKSFRVTGNNVLDAKLRFLAEEGKIDDEHVEETLTFVIEAPDGKRYDADFTGLSRDVVEEIEEGWRCDNCGETAMDGGDRCITCGQKMEDNATVDLRPLTGALTGLKKNVVAAARRVPIEEEVAAAASGMDMLADFVRAWPQFDTDEPVNGGDAVEYLEGMRADAIKVLNAAGVDTAKLRPEKPPTKSDIARDAAKKSGIPVIDYRVPLTDPVDLRGLPATPSAPLAFEYFEVRPCIDTDGCIQSFTDMDDFGGKMGEAAAARKSFRVWWTLYGIARDPEPDGAPEPGFHCQTIGDFDSWESALMVMNAILAPMAKARDALDAGFVFQFDRDGACDKIREASAILDDVINQSSNAERI